ncbi:MAG: DGQHR domain-containing protein [Terriglobia bacterium]
MVDVPAIRIQQFGVQFYQAALSAEAVGKLVAFEVLTYDARTKMSRRPAKSVSGKAKINWELLENVIRSSAEAYQRPIISKKIAELAEYYHLCAELNTLPSIPGSVLLVADHRLDFQQSGRDKFYGNLSIPTEPGVLRVLDGQHRLLALHQMQTDPAMSSGGRSLKDFYVPTVIFDFLPPDHAVEMFVTINAKHTRLNPSHIISLAGRRLYKDEWLAAAHDTIRALNEDKDSPLTGQIKVLGVGPGKVSQAALADEIKAIFTNMAAASESAAKQFRDDSRRFFVSYFKQVARTFESAWYGRKYSIKSSTALRAFIRIVPDVLQIIRSHRGEVTDALKIREAIAPWAMTIGDRRFETEGEWKLKLLGGTQSTVDLLTRELRAGLQHH